MHSNMNPQMRPSVLSHISCRPLSTLHVPCKRRYLSLVRSASDFMEEEVLNLIKELDLEEEFNEQPVSQQPSRRNACCFGCGTRLQTSNADAAGFVEPEKYELKRLHKQLNQLLCGRCQGLSNGAMLPGVADFAQLVQQQQSGSNATGLANKALVTPEQLREQLATVREQHALVVLLVDLLDASGSILSKVRDLVGRNPIILIGTKADLLPTATDLDNVAEWLYQLAEFKRINVADVYVLSSKQGLGVSRAVAAIRSERKGRDVYVLGAANVGKSAFIRALVQDMSKATGRQYDPKAAAQKQLPVESPMPGTTLGTIPLQVFSAGGVLYDTPGLHLHHRIPHMLTPDENKELHPRKKLKPFVAPAPGEVLELDTTATTPNKAASYAWGALVRIDILQGPEDMRLVFYGPPALRVTPSVVSSSSTPEDITSIVENQQGMMMFGEQSVVARGGYKVAKIVDISPKGSDCLANVAVSGVPGWVSVYSKSSVKLRVIAPVGVEVFVRPPLPVSRPIM